MSRPSQPVSPVDLGQAQAKLAGTFTYRFAGYAMRNLTQHRLLGVGQFVLGKDGKVEGKHTSSRMPMAGSVNDVVVRTYTLSGTLLLDDPLSGEALIGFVAKDPEALNLDAKFRFVVSGSYGRLWLISSGAQVPGETNSNLAELVSLEAERFAEA